MNRLARVNALVLLYWATFSVIFVMQRREMHCPAHAAGQPFGLSRRTAGIEPHSPFRSVEPDLLGVRPNVESAERGAMSF